MKNINVKATDHESYGTYTLLAVLIPLAGFIIGIIMLTKDEKVDRKLGEHLVAVSILMSIIGFAVWQYLIASQMQMYYPY